MSGHLRRSGHEICDTAVAIGTATDRSAQAAPNFSAILFATAALCAALALSHGGSDEVRCSRSPDFDEGNLEGEANGSNQEARSFS